jgi:hypothetical protein
MAETAKQAILSCQPFTMLRPENHEKWKDIEITFDPQFGQNLEAAPSPAPVQQPAQPASAGSQPDSSPQHKTPLTPQQLQEGLQKHRRTRVVPSGASQRIGFFTSLNSDCTNRGAIDIRITKNPEHGAVSFAAATDFPGYEKTSGRRKCKQHKVEGVQINYNSTENYIGDDTLELTCPLLQWLCLGNSIRRKRALNKEASTSGTWPLTSQRPSRPSRNVVLGQITELQIRATRVSSRAAAAMVLVVVRVAADGDGSAASPSYVMAI